MSPLHHHFELSGMSEVAVVLMFWGLQAVLGVVAVSAYFLASL
jgi:phospho-N-acetylmuramoyl-pentapeptide-transferase